MGLLGGVLIAGFLASPAMAGTTFIDFQTDARLLTDQTPVGILTGANDNATENKGVFSDNGSAILFSGSRVITSSLVTLKIRLNVASDTAANNADICMFIGDASNPVDNVSACFDGFDHSTTAELVGVLGSIDLPIDLPGVTDEYTLEYDPATEKATLSRAGLGGGSPASVFIDVALDGATSFVVGLFSTGGPVQLRNFTATGADIPDFPDPLDKDNPWVDFSLMSSGTGAQSDPFMFLSEALAVANPGATISIVPGTDSTETPTINQDVTLANSDFTSGSVSIGVSARRDAEEDLSTGGFISRGASVRRR